MRWNLLWRTSQPSSSAARAPGNPPTWRTTFFEALSLRDRALFFIEPHGESIYRIADALPRSLIKKTRIIDPLTLHAGFDPLLDTGLALTALQSIWADSWGDRMDYIPLNILITLKENDLTFSSLHKLVFSPLFRQKCIARLETQEVRAFWHDEFPKYEKDRNNPLSPILNKVQKINLLPRQHPIKSILCQDHPKLDFAEAIIDQHIILVNLNKGFIGDEATMILGALTTAAIMEAVLYINRPLIQDLQKPLSPASGPTNSQHGQTVCRHRAAQTQSRSLWEFDFSNRLAAVRRVNALEITMGTGSHCTAVRVVITGKCGRFF